MQTTNVIVNLLRRFCPVNGAHRLVQHRCVTNQLRILGCCRSFAFFDLIQGLYQKLRSQNRQPIQQLACCFVRADFRLADINDVACIHFTNQIHSRYTGFLQTVQHRPLIRGRATVLGKQAGVDVNAAKLGDIQHALRQNSAVGHNCHNIRLQIRKGLHSFFLFEILRLIHGNPGSQGNFLHRGEGHLHSPALGSVRLGIHRNNVRSVIQYSLQTGRRNIRRSHKHDSHFISSKGQSSKFSSSSVR